MTCRTAQPRLSSCSSVVQAFDFDQSAATNSGSVRNADSSAPSYAALNSETAAEITTLPSSEISSRSGIVSPMTSAAAPCFPATSLIRATLPGSQEITIRLASSPNKRKLRQTARQTPDSPARPRPSGMLFPPARPPMPPSAQSCADSTRPCSNQFDDSLLQPGFLLQIKFRRISPQRAQNFLRVFRRPELALCIGDIARFSRAQ